MIFDDIRAVMNSDTARIISKRTGLDQDQVRRMANGLPFTLDYETLAAFEKLGYLVKLEAKKQAHETATLSDTIVR